MDKIHVVEITKIDKHPSATRLKICEVSDGVNTTSVVCGASNAKLGMKTLLAPVGVTTPKGIQIEEADLRGVTSKGMLCSCTDLGIREEKGIVDLAPSIKLQTLWSDIHPDQLSSTPWYQYKLVEEFYIDESQKRISVNLGQKKPKGKLISQTYFYEGNYLHRHFE